jgi:hypothetical protein
MIMMLSGILMRGAAMIAAGVLSAMPAASGRQDEASELKYRLRAVPGNLQVDRMPGPGPAKSYEETFTFVVGNAGAAEYAGHAPSCQTFDIVVTPVDHPDQVVWQWSHGQMFCMMVTEVKIAGHGRWKKSEAWKFTTADVTDGKYRATATFIAEKKTATVDFEVTSVQ